MTWQGATSLSERVDRLGRRPEQLSDSLYVYRDACNVYVVKQGEAAVLIDSGSGAVWGHLGSLGIGTVDWVIHTHHHRDQCLGSLVRPPEARLAVPQAEARHFAAAERYWQEKQLFNLYDCGSDFDSPAQSMAVDTELAPYEQLRWGDLVFLVVPTPGHTKGSTTYVASIDGTRVAFCGDVVSSVDGRLDSLYDLQWDGIYPDGLNVALHSIAVLQDVAPDVLAPAHGHVIDDPREALAGLETRVGAVHAAIAERFAGGTTDPTRPGVGTGQATRFSQVSEHVISAEHGRAHFHVVHDGAGNALLFDYGFATEYHARSLEYFVPHSLPELQSRFGIERIEVVVPTHYHHDHVAGLGFLRRHHGARVWAHEVFAGIIESPASYRLPALWHEPVRVDRVLRDGETFSWRGVDFTSWRIPGHTWYQSVTVAVIDGRRFAVTGDALFRNGRGLLCGGAPMYRNRVEGDSFSTGVSTIVELSPEILLTGHSGSVVLGDGDLAEALAWSRRMEQAWRDAASSERPVEFALDPDVVTVFPYALTCTRGSSCSVEVRARNHFEHAVDAWVCVTGPEGWSIRPAEQELRIPGRSTGAAEFEIEAGPTARAGDRQVLVAHAILGERVLLGAGEGLLDLRDAGGGIAVRPRCG